MGVFIYIICMEGLYSLHEMLNNYNNFNREYHVFFNILGDVASGSNGLEVSSIPNWSRTSWPLISKLGKSYAGGPWPCSGKIG